LLNLNKDWLKKLLSKTSSKNAGELGEERALTFLKANGLILVAANYRTKMGEIDLIMLQDNVLVFVEVKLRSSSRYGSAEEQVTHSKQLKIIKTAQYFLLKHKKWQQFPARFDIVAINNQHAPPIWIKDAFQLQ
jgi:putative endonuclease